jgi:hypothetical protein
MVKVICFKGSKETTKKDKGIGNCVMEEIITVKDMVRCTERIT